MVRAGPGVAPWPQASYETGLWPAASSAVTRSANRDARAPHPCTSSTGRAVAPGVGGDLAPGAVDVRTGGVVDGALLAPYAAGRPGRRQSSSASRPATPGATRAVALSRGADDGRREPGAARGGGRVGGVAVRVMAVLSVEVT